MSRILFIAPLFFNYYKEILNELKSMGHEVDYTCDAPSNSNLIKAISRINSSFIKYYTYKYFVKEVKPSIDSKQYDYVFLLAGMTFALSPNMISYIKNNQKNAKFFMYQWDSEKNLKYCTKIHSYMDKVFSFDLTDCSKSKKYIFLPLFYTDSYKNIGASKIDSFKYDCCYIGTAHPQKFHYINLMSSLLSNLLPRQYIYHYMPSKLKFFYHKLISTEFKNAVLNDFQLAKLSTNEILNVIKESRCILDAPQSGQTGLTIRTIECLGAKRKLITSNNDIIKYDFYNKQNILVFDGNIDPNNSFFTTPYRDIDEEIYKKYSIRSWLNTIFDFH